MIKKTLKTKKNEDSKKTPFNKKPQKKVKSKKI